MSTDTIKFTNQPSTSNQVAGKLKTIPTAYYYKAMSQLQTTKILYMITVMKLAMLFVVRINDTKKVNVIL